MIIVSNIIGFAAVIFVLCKIYKHFETSYLVVQFERVEERV